MNDGIRRFYLLYLNRRIATLIQEKRELQELLQKEQEIKKILKGITLAFLEGPAGWSTKHLVN
jgi:hypothetical protein